MSKLLFYFVVLCVLMPIKALAVLRCDITYKNDAKNEVVKTISVSKTATFKGLGPNEEYVLNVDRLKTTLKRNSFFKTKDKPYAQSSITCDRYLNCSGAHTLFVNKESKAEALRISPAGASVQAQYGSRILFRYSQVNNGFVYQYIDTDLGANKFYGVIVACKN